MLYCSIDLETTGLVPEIHSIIEVACIIVDDKLKEVARFSRPVRPPFDVRETFPEHIDKTVREMHQESGLWEELREGSGWSLDTAQAELVDFFKGTKAEFGGDDPKIMLMGNSIASLDLPFLRKHMPDAGRQCFYRTIDVSGFYEAVKLFWGKEILPRPEKKNAHRAMDDALECLDLLRHIQSALPIGMRLL